MGTIFVAQDMAARLEETEFKLTPATMNSMGTPFPMLTIPGFVVTLPDGKSARVRLGKLRFKKLGYGLVRAEGAKPCLGTLYTLELEIALTVSERANEILFEDFASVGKGFEDMIRTFVHLTGREAVVEVSTLTTVPSAVRTDGKLRILVGALPPGPLAASRLRDRTSPESSMQKFCTNYDRPAMGVGTVVYDHEEIAVAQIIGDDIYLLVKVTRNDIRLFKEAFVHATREALALAWEAYLKPEPVERVVLTDPESLADTSEAWIDSLAAMSQEALKEAGQKVKEAEKAYTEALSDLKIRQLAVRTVPAFRETFQTGREQMLVSWKVVLGHSLTNSIEEVEQGFHLTTNEVVIEHEGKEYPIGRFGIRLDLEGEFTVWNPHPTHPTGEPHPHISKDGAICYGNITLAIRERIIVKRDYAGAMLMVLDWLANAYEPASTLHPIEEWPTKETT